MNNREYTNRVIPGAIAGQIMVGTELVDLRDFTDTYIWDSEFIPLGTVITPQQQLPFFSSLTQQLVPGVRKLRVQTSMTEPSRLPGNWNAILKNIWFGFGMGTLRVDAEAILQSAYISFILGQQRIEREGPAMLFPMPAGLAGPLSLDGAAVATEVSNYQNGMAARNTVPNMLPITLPGGMQFTVNVQFDIGFTAVGNINVYIIAPAYISKPIM